MCMNNRNIFTLSLLTDYSIISGTLMEHLHMRHSTITIHFRRETGNTPLAKASDRSLQSPGPRAFISCPRHPPGGARGQQHCMLTFPSDHDQLCLQKPFTLQCWDFSSMRGKKMSNQRTVGSEPPPCVSQHPCQLVETPGPQQARGSIPFLSLKQRALQTKRDGKLKNHEDSHLKNIKKV